MHNIIDFTFLAFFSYIQTMHLHSALYIRLFIRLYVRRTNTLAPRAASADVGASAVRQRLFSNFSRTVNKY